MSVPVVFSTGPLYPFGLDRSYGWAAEAGYDDVEIMMDERRDTVQDAYLNYIVEKHGIPILALHTPLYEGVWRLDPEETLVRSAKPAAKIGTPVVIVHPPPPGRPLPRWAAGLLEHARGEGVRVAVENMPRDHAKYAFSIRRNRIYHLPEHLLGIGDVMLDTSHLGASGVDLLEAWETLRGQLRYVHLSDSDLSSGDQHRLAGKGKLPLKQLLGRIGESYYPGALSLEIKPWLLGKPDPMVILERMRGALE